MSKDSLYLVHIAECIERIEEYTAQGRDFFFKDRKTQDAVLRNLHTLAESCQRLSDEARSKQPEVDWKSIIAFRQVVVHDYLGVDLNQIWDIVQNDLLNLKTAVQNLQKESR